MILYFCCKFVFSILFIQESHFTPWEWEMTLSEKVKIAQISFIIVVALFMAWYILDGGRDDKLFK